jgi:hypothetical protein
MSLFDLPPLFLSVPLRADEADDELEDLDDDEFDDEDEDWEDDEEEDDEDEEEEGWQVRRRRR